MQIVFVLRIELLSISYRRESLGRRGGSISCEVTVVVLSKAAFWAILRGTERLDIEGNQRASQHVPSRDKGSVAVEQIRSILCL